MFFLVRCGLKKVKERGLHQISGGSATGVDFSKGPLCVILEHLPKSPNGRVIFSCEITVRKASAFH